MMRIYKLPVQITPLEEGGYLAVCPVIQGCHAEGKTISETLENLEDVAKNLIEVMEEDGIDIHKMLSEFLVKEKPLRINSEIVISR